MPQERTYLLVKPDGMLNGGIDTAVSQLDQAGLVIRGFRRIRLTTEDVTHLYPQRKNAHLWQTNLDYLSGGESGLLVVEGEQAIDKVTQIKGKTWASGLRKDYAGNFIHNTFHSPDTASEARADLDWLLSQDNTKK